jgi:hypothetical protein
MKINWSTVLEIAIAVLAVYLLKEFILDSAIEKAKTHLDLA